MLNRKLQIFRKLTQGEAQAWWTLVAVEFGNFVVYMDGFLFPLAMPAMARQFGADLHILKWVIVAYLFCVTVTLLPAGRLADTLGRKRVIVTGMTVLTLGTVLCILAPSLKMLIACRALQGIGGGLILANVMAEITSAFPRKKHRQAMAINASVLALAQITGLVLGGLLIDQLGWRFLFLLILLVNLLGLILTLVILESRPWTKEIKQLDWIGTILAIGAVGAPFLFVEQLSGDLLDSGGLFLLAGAITVLAIFIAVELRSNTPLLELSVLRIRAFTCGSVSAAFYFVSAVSCYFLIPLYSQIVLGLSAMTSGLVLVPVSLAITVSSLTVGRLNGRFCARTLSTAGMLCVCCGLFGLSLLDTKSFYAEMVWPLLLLGAGGGMFHPPNNSSTLGNVPPEHLGIANGFLATARNFGQAIGISLAAMLLARGLAHEGSWQALTGTVAAGIDSLHLQVYVSEQQFIFRLAAALGLVGALISVLRGSDVPSYISDEPKI